MGIVLIVSFIDLIVCERGDWTVSGCSGAISSTSRMLVIVVSVMCVLDIF